MSVVMGAFFFSLQEGSAAVCVSSEPWVYLQNTQSK